MPRSVAEAIVIGVFATIVTAVIAAPVLRAPSERVFGMEIVGRHHDPFTMMEQFERPLAVGVYSQPVTDLTGRLLARIAGPVAAYNWLILLSFPLSAVAAYLLARHLSLAPAGAAVAAMAYAFSPFHIAQAAYHVHIAQTQWVPLYLLALWRCLDRASPIRVALLAAAALAVALSNFYGGLVAAVMTLPAMGAYWIVACRSNRRSVRDLGVTAMSLGLIAASGMAYAWYMAGAVVSNRAAFAFPRADLFRYSAKWWAYLLPPMDHPLVGARVYRFLSAAGIREGLLEQQVSLGWGVVALGVAAIIWSLRRDRQALSVARVPILVVVAAAALVCSLSPERAIGPFTFVRPSALLYDVVPMFRAYARFGVVVQLMAALLAGIGVERMLRAGTLGARMVCAMLLVLAVGEYAVWPPALWRDVLPTAAHRWVVQQGAVHVLDCTPLTQESASVVWLTQSRVTLLDGSIGDCAEPNLPEKLAAKGYSHLLIRKGASDSASLTGDSAPAGLRLAAHFPAADVFAVTAPTPPVYTGSMAGFFDREHDQARSWRWMGADGTWSVVNPGPRPIVATLAVELAAFHCARGVELRFDGRHVQTVVVDQPRRVYELGPFTIDPGSHALSFRPLQAPAIAAAVIDTSDQRALSVALGSWSWTVRSETP